MRLLRLATTILAAVTLSACVPSSYMGISTSGPPSETELNMLKLGRQAFTGSVGFCIDGDTGLRMPCSFLPVNMLALYSATGSKHAQMELGRRFEFGRDVERDLIKAEKLYEKAASTSGGPFTTCIWDEYQKRCNLMTIDQPYEYGLPEARIRLKRVQARLNPTPDLSDGVTE